MPHNGGHETLTRHLCQVSTSAVYVWYGCNLTQGSTYSIFNIYVNATNTPVHSNFQGGYRSSSLAWQCIRRGTIWILFVRENGTRYSFAPHRTCLAPFVTTLKYGPRQPLSTHTDRRNDHLPSTVPSASGRHSFHLGMNAVFLSTSRTQHFSGLPANTAVHFDSEVYRPSSNP